MGNKSTINVLSYAGGIALPNTSQKSGFVMEQVQKTITYLQIHDPTALGIIAKESTPENIGEIWRGIDEKTSNWGEFRETYRLALMRILSTLDGFSHHNCTLDEFTHFQDTIRNAEASWKENTQ